MRNLIISALLILSGSLSAGEPAQERKTMDFYNQVKNSNAIMLAKVSKVSLVDRKGKEINDTEASSGADADRIIKLQLDMNSAEQLRKPSRGMPESVVLSCNETKDMPYEAVKGIEGKTRIFYLEKLRNFRLVGSIPLENNTDKKDQIIMMLKNVYEFLNLAKTDRIVYSGKTIKDKDKITKVLNILKKLPIEGDMMAKLGSDVIQSEIVFYQAEKELRTLTFYDNKLDDPSPRRLFYARQNRDLTDQLKKILGE